MKPEAQAPQLTTEEMAIGTYLRTKFLELQKAAQSAQAELSTYIQNVANAQGRQGQQFNLETMTFLEPSPNGKVKDEVLTELPVE